MHKLRPQAHNDGDRVKMGNNAENNKRIAKNTLLLYIRMLFLMCITLYTSRVVLNTLGVIDYGIYNVVGGIVSMFGFINTSMAAATQRYITFAIGKNDTPLLQKTFSTALQIHVLIAIIIVILSETVGLWFLYNKLQIPPERMDAAFWILQFSIIDAFVMIISVPYNADIIAHERMSAFAYISVLEGILKLAIVFVLLLYKCDKLILYAFLLLVVQLIIRFCYSTYCNRHFFETKYKNTWDKKLFGNLVSFAGWSIWGNLAAIIMGQGLNFLLNIFFGPIANTARGIALQVQSAVQQFVSNFQMALNPQITKTYAQGEMSEMHNLMFRSARFSFYLLFLLSLPILFETKFVLTIWLKIVPEYTVTFLRLMICISLLYTLANPMVIANQATGKVKKYQAVCGSTLILILPISYLCLRMGFPAYSVFIVNLIMECICQLLRMIMLRNLIDLKLREYFINIYSRVIMVIIGSTIIPFILYNYLAESILRFLIICLTSAVSVITISYLLGMTNNEKAFVRNHLKTIACKIK